MNFEGGRAAQLQHSLFLVQYSKFNLEPRVRAAISMHFNDLDPLPFEQSHVAGADRNVDSPAVGGPRLVIAWFDDRRGFLRGSTRGHP